MALAQSNKILYLPPPTGGLNFISPLADMPESDTPYSKNVNPDARYSKCRDGITSVAGADATLSFIASFLMSLNKSDGSIVFLLVDGLGAASSITSSGVSAVVPASGCPYYWCEFRNRIFMAQATKTPRDWDGTTYTATAWTGPTVTGLTNPWSYKGRMYFAYSVSGNQTSVWYGGVSAITGALTELPLLSIWTKGGYTAFGGTTVLNFGNVTEEFCVFVSSMGEVLVYQGDDPSASNWQIVGRFFISPPAHRFSFFYYGGDLHVVTTQSVISVRDLMAGQAATGRFQSLTEKIDPEIAKSASNPFISAIFLRATVSPRENLLYLYAQNSSSGVEEYGFFVMNLVTKAWGWYTVQEGSTGSSPYLNLCNAVSSATDIYYCVSEVGVGVHLIKGGQIDQIYDTLSTNIDINYKLQHSFVSGNQNTNKKFNKIRPIIKDQSTLTIGSYSDFDTTLASQSVAVSLSMNKKFYDINKEAFYLSLYIAGSSSDTDATGLPEYHGSLLSYELGSNIP